MQAEGSAQPLEEAFGSEAPAGLQQAKGGVLSLPTPEGLQEAGGGSHHLHDEVSTHATLVSRLLEPGVLRRDTESRMLRDKGHLLPGQRLPPGLRTPHDQEEAPAPCSASLAPGRAQLTHQEVLLAVHLLAHMVERLPAESSPCNNKGRARVPGSLDTRDGDSASISQHPLPRDVKWIKDEFLNFPLMLLILY